MTPHIASKNSDQARLAAEFHALSDRTRLELVEVIGSQDRSYLTVAEMADKVGVSPALASYHLGIAKKAGLLKSSIRGQFNLTLYGEWWLSALESRRSFADEMLAQVGLSIEALDAP